MQPYQADENQLQGHQADEQYQMIPEDQAHPVFFRRRRDEGIGPVIIPLPYSYYPPYYYPYPYPYSYPYYPYPYQPFPFYGGGF
ncbi:MULTISPECIES: hypothetical protein [Brevibacillus]|jgi:hypothetical protein|uniref:Uncharacterized protein n=1 Tax=Brevibacillus parabrevis TaxID=54914 RepID=A0A4Y3PJ86_BREPA|nr:MULTISPECIES: hypothetical protein [Brevibacillus]MBU8714037.1 hypothetical protein [Brevibacillus parabrevis]MDH6350493.1 hypothetical protein [Brevibacillus sp. 1238]MDR4998451.1 hypothetical protein [Brevibacillus parabrevis]MED2255596.1 hypothetical protein [Brevibacillus parabrevis]NRQ54209.1 hypothetical protein [Brevibacillus sp. HD1.4A]